MLFEGWCWQNKEIEMEVCVCVLCDIASGVYLLTFFDLQDD